MRVDGKNIRVTDGHDFRLGDDGVFHVSCPPRRRRLIEWGRAACAALVRGWHEQAALRSWARGRGPIQ